MERNDNEMYTFPAFMQKFCQANEYYKGRHDEVDK